LFVIRNAGTIVPAFGPEPGGVSATVEYVVAVLGVTDIIICSHSHCGAMTAISTGMNLDHLPAVASWLAHADAAKAVIAARTHGSAQESLKAMVRGNVVAQLTNIRTHPSVALALDQGRLNLHGWVWWVDRSLPAPARRDNRQASLMPLSMVRCLICILPVHH